MKQSLSRFLQRPHHLVIYRLVGWKLACSYMLLLGRLYYNLYPDEWQRITDSIDKVFAGTHDLKRIYQPVFEGIIFHYYEKLFNAFSGCTTIRKFFNTHVADHGVPLIADALSEGKGALVITGHYGGVEFIPGFLGHHGLHVSIVAKFSSARLKERSVKKASKFNIEIIDAGKEKNVFNCITSCLKKNRIVVTQCDEIEAWRPDRRKTLSFLGQRIYLDRSFNILCGRTRSPIFFNLMHRCKDKSYAFIAAPVLKPSVSDSSFGEMLLKMLEAYIYRYPWEWYQWKKIPVLPVSATRHDEAEPFKIKPLLFPV